MERFPPELSVVGHVPMRSPAPPQGGPSCPVAGVNDVSGRSPLLVVVTRLAIEGGWHPTGSCWLAAGIVGSPAVMLHSKIAPAEESANPLPVTLSAPFTPAVICSSGEAYATPEKTVISTPTTNTQIPLATRFAGRPWTGEMRCRGLGAGLADRKSARNGRMLRNS